MNMLRHLSRFHVLAGLLATTIYAAACSSSAPLFGGDGGDGDDYVGGFGPEPSCQCQAGAYCDYTDNTCRPVKATGEPCSRSEECSSNRCGQPAGSSSAVCLVPAAPFGGACTVDDCDLCKNDGTFCTRSCPDEDKCSFSQSNCPSGFVCHDSECVKPCDPGLTIDPACPSIHHECLHPDSCLGAPSWCAWDK